MQKTMSCQHPSCALLAPRIKAPRLRPCHSRERSVCAQNQSAPTQTLSINTHPLAQLKVDSRTHTTQAQPCTQRTSGWSAHLTATCTQVSTTCAHAGAWIHATHKPLKPYAGQTSTEQGDRSSNAYTPPAQHRPAVQCRALCNISYLQTATCTHVLLCMCTQVLMHVHLDQRQQCKNLLIKLLVPPLNFLHLCKPLTHSPNS